MGTLTTGNIKAGALESSGSPVTNTHVGFANSTVTHYESTGYASGGQKIETFDFTESGLSNGEAFVYEKSGAGKLQGYPGFCIVSDQGNGSQVFVDRGPSKYIITPLGDVHHDTGGSVNLHNPTAIYMDGTGDYLRVHDSHGLGQLGTADWTFECWFYSGATGSEAFWGIDDYYYPITVLTSDSGILCNMYYNNTQKIAIAASGLNAIERDSKWHHHAVVRRGPLFGIYLDGKLRQTDWYDGPIGRFTGWTSNNTGDFFIGHSEYDASTPKFTGYMDDIRFIRGKAVYTQDFVPPSRSPQGTEINGDVADYTKITMMGYRSASSSYFTAINYVAGNEIVARDYMGIGYDDLKSVAYSGSTQKIMIFNNTNNTVKFTAYVEATT